MAQSTASLGGRRWAWSDTGALVTDAQFESSVSGIRALGEAGVRVVALGDRWRAAGLWSRHAGARVVAAHAPQEFAATLAAVAAAHGPLVVYPSTEQCIDALVASTDALPQGVVLPFPVAALPRVRTKSALPELAAKAGLACPPTVAEVVAGGLRDQELPCVAKPADPASPHGPPRVLQSPADLEALLDKVPADETMLVQELVRGRQLSLALVVARDGGVVACFQEEVRGTWPAAAGRITRSISVPADRELVEQASQLLAAAGYWGLAQVDLIVTPSGPVLLDVNPRLYGCMALALSCGVNLPAAWHSVALDEVPSHTPLPGYRAGVSYHWLEGDLSTLELRALRPPPRPRTGAVWAPHDPIPGLLSVWRAVETRAARRLPGRRPQRAHDA